MMRASTRSSLSSLAQLALLFVLVLLAIPTVASAVNTSTPKLLSSSVPLLTFDPQRGPWWTNADRTLDAHVHETQLFMHLSNVVFKINQEQERQVHLFNLTAIETDFVTRVLKRKLEGYRSFISGDIRNIPAYRLYVHEEPLDTSHCHRTHDVTAFFISPWHCNNIFHLHNNNLLSLLQGIQSSPQCNATTLECSPPSKLFILKSDVDRNARNVPAALLLQNIFNRPKLSVDALFSKDVNACVSRVVWGRGLELFYYDTLSGNVNLSVKRHSNGSVAAIDKARNETLPLATMRRVSDALFQQAAKTIQPNLQNQSSKSRSVIHSSMPHRLLAIDRKDKRKFDVTVIPAVNASARQLGLEWSVMRDEDFKVPFSAQLTRLIDNDILVGAHGSGLANAFYMRRRRVVIELQPTPRYSGWLIVFRNMVWTRGSAYIVIETENKGGIVATGITTSHASLNCSIFLATLYLEREANELIHAGRCTNLPLAERDAIRVMLPPSYMQTDDPDPEHREQSDLVTVGLESVAWPASTMSVTSQGVRTYDWLPWLSPALKQSPAVGNPAPKSKAAPGNPVQLTPASKGIGKGDGRIQTARAAVEKEMLWQDAKHSKLASQDEKQQRRRDAIQAAKALAPK